MVAEARKKLSSGDYDFCINFKAKVAPKTQIALRALLFSRFVNEELKRER